MAPYSLCQGTQKELYTSVHQLIGKQTSVQATKPIGICETASAPLGHSQGIPRECLLTQPFTVKKALIEIQVY